MAESLGGPCCAEKWVAPRGAALVPGVAPGPAGTSCGEVAGAAPEAASAGGVGEGPGPVGAPCGPEA